MKKAIIVAAILALVAGCSKWPKHTDACVGYCRAFKCQDNFRDRQMNEDYTIMVNCDNCHYYGRLVVIPYGTPKEEVLDTLKCHNCGIVGGLYSVPVPALGTDHD